MKHEVWTLEKENCLREVASRAYKLSAQKIAENLTKRGFPTTRNSVIGKMKRLGLKLHLPPHIKQTKKPMKKTPKPDKPEPKPEYVVSELFNGKGKLTLEELTNQFCAWPLEEDPANTPTGCGDKTYCGEVISYGESYCQAHCRAAYRSWISTETNGGTD